MNLVITLSITAVKNRLILVFFILVAPVAAGAVVAFRAKIHRENRSFRQGNGGNQRKGDGDGRNGPCRQGSCPGG